MSFLQPLQALRTPEGDVARAPVAADGAGGARRAVGHAGQPGARQVGEEEFLVALGSLAAAVGWRGGRGQLGVDSGDPKPSWAPLHPLTFFIKIQRRLGDHHLGGVEAQVACRRGRIWGGTAPQPLPEGFVGVGRCPPPHRWPRLSPPRGDKVPLVQLNCVAATSIFSCRLAVMFWSFSSLCDVTARDTMMEWSTTTLPGLGSKHSLQIQTPLFFFFPWNDPKIPVSAHLRCRTSMPL